MSLPIRAAVRRMQPYPAGKPAAQAQAETGLPRVVKLASNENPLGPSPRAVEAAAHAAAALHVYPDCGSSELRRALACSLDVPEASVVLGNGSDDLIHLLGLAFLEGQDDEVVVGEPSFVRYDATAHVAGCRLVEVPCLPDWRLDAAAMVRAVGGRTKLVFVANPNNPTGTYLTAGELEPLAAALEGRGLLVLDEAYYEFARGLPGYPDAVGWVREGRPVAVLRTFSKAHGLAGARVGYLVGPPELADALDRVREPFNVNSVAQAAAVASVADRAHLDASVLAARQSLDQMVEKAAFLGLRTVPSAANFVCIEVGDDREAASRLEQLGFVVRPGEAIGMPGFIRVSAGLPEDTKAFCAALEAALGLTPTPAGPGHRE